MSDLDRIAQELKADTSLEQAEELPGHDKDRALLAQAARVLEGLDLSPATIEFILRLASRESRVSTNRISIPARLEEITSRRLTRVDARLLVLRQARESSRMSAERASTHLGTSVPVLERIEAGETDALLALAPDAVVDYARAIGVDPSEVLRALFQEAGVDKSDRVDSEDRDDQDRRWIVGFFSALEQPTTREEVKRLNWKWTNRSVTRFAGGADPVEEMVARAQAVAVAAKDNGWSGPPFDPIKLAETLRIEVVPNDGVKDARTVPTPTGVRIEFNPNRPRPRIRYSIAHEIGHTLFPDCRAYIRNRASYHDLHGDEWQIESLCNIAAAEFLMPAGSLRTLPGIEPGIDHALSIREQFQVSVEAALIRLVRSWVGSCAMFVVSRADEGHEAPFRLDYVIGSPSWRIPIPKGSSLPTDSLVKDCTTVGFTAKGAEIWFDSTPRLRVECVAIAPFPGSSYTYLVGDAASPRGTDTKLIAHIVNDATTNWGGGGFAQFIRRKWPHVQEDFKSWAVTHPKEYALGRVRPTEVHPGLWIVHMIAQHGYGPSARPRIRYQALQSCLQRTAELAVRLNASVHMPRIGTGQAGGEWSVIEDLVKAQLCEKDIKVSVYDPSGTSPSMRAPEAPPSRTD